MIIPVWKNYISKESMDYSLQLRAHQASFTAVAPQLQWNINGFQKAILKSAKTLKKHKSDFKKSPIETALKPIVGF